MDISFRQNYSNGPVSKKALLDRHGGSLYKHIKGNQKAAKWSNESKYSKLKKH